ncbi:hypothetical protein NPIL_560301 [Nephila pilipes]|uniref:Endonuclease/exonuclease/phosphatase domain-containing protein n=1 Tax=Nephila pilipes TaxID=299642 RepID=A0A8X6M777_NEPPI|nr:hypothetical protein NPIL_560301 [Nephila pilipes]
MFYLTSYKAEEAEDSLHAPDQPTKLNYRGDQSTLDLCISKGLHSITAETSPELSSDHYPAKFMIHLQDFTTPPYYNIKFTNWKKFQNHLALITPGNPPISSTQELDEAASNFSTLYSRAIETEIANKYFHHFVLYHRNENSMKNQEKTLKKRHWTLLGVIN